MYADNGNILNSVAETCRLVFCVLCGHVNIVLLKLDREDTVDVSLRSVETRLYMDRCDD